MADEARTSSSSIRRAASMLSQDEELRRKKRALASLVVHDLRSPLSGAVNCIEMMRHVLDTSADINRLRGLTGDIQELLIKALSLVATILDVDELEDGMLRVRPVATLLAELVDAAHGSTRAGFELLELRWSCDIPGDLEVEVDPSLFGRVIENLVDNATRYAPRRGRVAVVARRDGDAIVIEVGNNGPPVPEPEREAIFGRYYQVEARRASARANRGLGLYFCRLAIEAHGGTITVEERPDLHATFVVRLPQPPVVPVGSEDSRRLKAPSEPPPHVERPTPVPRSRVSTVEIPVPPIPKAKKD